MNNIQKRNIWLIVSAVAFMIALISMMINCAMLPTTRTIDPNSWVQLDPSEMEFMSGSTNKVVMFAKVVEQENGTALFLLGMSNPSLVFAGSIFDEGNDGTIDKAFLTIGAYNDKVAEDGFPFTARNYPKQIRPDQMHMVKDDFDYVLEQWKTGKHISLAEMNAIVKASATPKNEAVTHYPTDGRNWPTQDFVWFKKHHDDAPI